MGILQLDDWVLCRIYEKCTHAQRAGKEHDNSSVEEVLASLPEIDDMLPQCLPESEQQQQLTTSENGYLIDSLHRGMMSNNTGVVSMHENLQTASALTNEWKLMETTSYNQRGMMSQDMASVAQRQQQTLNIGPMSHPYTQRSFKPAVIGGRSASDEEVQSTFRCSRGFSSSNEGSLETMFPAMSYEHGNAQSYAHLGPAMATSWFNSSYDCT